MELFKIICVTCQAKLSVRNESLIGQIVACPRCESMVQIERPAATAAVLAAPVEAATQPIPIPQPAPVPEPIAELPVAEEIPIPPEAPPVSISVAKYKLLGWTLGAFVAGAAIVGAVLLLRGDSSAEIESSPVVVTSQEPVEVEDPVAEEVEAVQEPEVIEEPVVKPVIEERTDVEVVVTKSQASEDPFDEKPEVVVEVVVETVAVEDVPKVARRFDPLDFDPENLDLAAISSVGVAEASQPSADEPIAIEAETDIGEPLPSTLPSVRRDPEQTVVPAVAVEQLKQRFPALQVNKMPLGDFLTLVSRLSAVPVSVAPEELQMAGITARKEVSLNAKDVDLNEALKSALRPLHLEHVVEGPLVRVVRKGGAKMREVNYPLDDLSAVASVEEITAWIEQLVAPQEWQTVGGDGTIQKSANSLKVKQVQRVQYQVLIFLERLRLANELAPRSRFPIKRLAGAPAQALLASRLEAPTVFTFSRYTGLQEIAGHWQAELGVPILMDWPALAEVDIWPQTRIACSIEDKPWRTALSEVLEPLGLGWRAVAGEMIEITTLLKVQTQPQLELYSLVQAPSDGTDRMLAELDSLAAVKSTDLVSSEPARFEYDSGGKVVFVLQSAAVQRKVYGWLVQNRLVKSD